jgi:hypothetical protein
MDGVHSDVLWRLGLRVGTTVLTVRVRELASDFDLPIEGRSMSYVDEAFEEMREKSEITPAEQDYAQKRHREIRDHIAGNWDLDEPPSFLTGSYDRHTKIRQLRDVDIFVVIDPKGSQGNFRYEAPRKVLEALRDLLKDKYSKVEIDRLAVRVLLGPKEHVVSFEVVPAFSRSGGGYWIPDDRSGKWIASDPNEHADLSSEKNDECGEKYVPFVKMVKGWNREQGDPVDRSFLLEVIALKVVPVPFGRYQDELVTFFATAADRISQPWPDPAGLGPDVNAEMTSSEANGARNALETAAEIANGAVILEDEGHERQAVEKWRELFKSRMPLP